MNCRNKKKKTGIFWFLLLILTSAILLTTGCIHTDQPGFRMDIWVLKTDSNGTMEWMATISDDPNNRGESIIRTPDGGYAIAGTGTDLLQKGPVPAIFMLDRHGSIRPVIHTGTSPDYGSSITTTPDNGYVLASYSGILSKVNDNGTVLWTIPLHEGRDWWKVAGIPGGGFAVAGTNKLVRIDENGTILWIAPLGNNRNASAILGEPDGGIITGGISGTNVWVARFTNQGKPVFDTTIDSISPAALYMLWVSPAGTYEIIYGSTEYSGDGIHGRWISNTSRVSLALDGRIIKKQQANASRIITATGDGGYACAGFAVPEFTELKPQGTSDSYLRLVRTDRDGNQFADTKYMVGNNGVVSSIIHADDQGFVIMGRRNNI